MSRLDRSCGVYGQVVRGAMNDCRIPHVRLQLIDAIDNALQAIDHFSLYLVETLEVEKEGLGFQVTDILVFDVLNSTVMR